MGAFGGGGGGGGGGNSTNSGEGVGGEGGGAGDLTGGGSGGATCFLDCAITNAHRNPATANSIIFFFIFTI